MNRARQIRLDKGLGVKETADTAGISTKTLHKIEAGDDVLSGSLARLARFYDVRTTELLLPAEYGERAA